MPQAFLHKLCPELRKAEYRGNPEQPYRIIVEMNQPGTGRIASFVNRNLGTIHREMDLFPGLVADLPFSHIQELTWSPY